MPDLDQLRELADAGQLHVPLAGTFSLANAKQAFEQIETSHTTGKLIIVL